MSIPTVLLDLGGTLLPMDQKEFKIGYFELLAEKMSACGKPYPMGRVRCFRFLMYHYL